MTMWSMRLRLLALAMLPDIDDGDTGPRPLLLARSAFRDHRHLEAVFTGASRVAFLPLSLLA
jgi:hypothetical protein